MNFGGDAIIRVHHYVSYCDILEMTIWQLNSCLSRPWCVLVSWGRKARTNCAAALSALRDAIGDLDGGPGGWKGSRRMSEFPGKSMGKPWENCMIFFSEVGLYGIEQTIKRAARWEMVGTWRFFFYIYIYICVCIFWEIIERNRGFSSRSFLIGSDERRASIVYTKLYRCINTICLKQGHVRLSMFFFFLVEFLGICFTTSAEAMWGLRRPSDSMGKRVITNVGFWGAQVSKTKYITSPDCISHSTLHNQ